MKLSDYTKIKDNKERVHTFLNDNAEWMENYIEDCPDFINMYGDLLYADTDFYLDECEDETKTLLEYLIENDETDLIFNSCEVEHTKGIWRRSNELASCNLGEQEVQFSGLSDGSTNCIYTEITKNIDPEELKIILDSSEQCVSSDCLYLDYSYDRASLILDDEKLIDNFLKEAV